MSAFWVGFLCGFASPIVLIFIIGILWLIVGMRDTGSLG